MRKRTLLILTGSLVAACSLVAGALAAAQDGLDLSWNIIAAGGGRSTSGAYVLDATIGQAAVGRLTSAGYQLSSGFWAFLGAWAPEPTPSGTLPPTSTPTGTLPATSTPVATATATLVATPTQLSCPNILAHGDFEAGIVPPWGASARVQVTTSQAHGGAQSARLGGTNNAVDELSVGLELPADAASVTLSYWWYVESTDPNLEADIMAVVVGPAGSEVVAETLSNTSPRDSWHSSTIDLTGHAGQSVAVIYHAETNEAHGTSFYVDDVAVEVCAAPGPANRIRLPIVLRSYP